MQQKNESFIPKEEGTALAEKIGAIGYCECSALTQDGLHEVFDKVIEATSGIKDTGRAGGKKCVLL